MNKSKPKIIVICGPTASGKSDIAVSLAQKLSKLNLTDGTIAQGKIISADSRQVYKGLDIGTGKITKEEMKGVPHHLLDVADPKEIYAVSDYVRDAQNAVQEIIKKGSIPVICGGTGFYIDALLGDKMIPEVPPNDSLRKELETKTVEELFSMLQEKDPERAETIDAKNPRRLIRALEIIDSLGSVPKLQALSSKLQASPYHVCKIGIKIEEEELKRRIHTRLLKRMEQGMVEEAERLHAEGLSYERMIDLGLEYRYLALFLQQKISKEEMLTQLEMEIWHYAKRQMTWFKKDKSIVWFTPTRGEQGRTSIVEGFPPNIEMIEKEVEKFLNSKTSPQ